MEADLSRYHQLDLRDLWRGGLTLRQVNARVNHLPPESACARAVGGHGWTNSELLLADLFHTQAGIPHPADPRTAIKTQNVAGLRRMKKRAQARRRELGITGSVLRRQ